jgi:SPX domain protein involved in polyphosphate accumulation
MLIVHDLSTRTRAWQKQTQGVRGRYAFLPGVVVMKFGEQLRSSAIREYQWYYIAYDELKAQLRTPLVSPRTAENPRPKHRPWTEEDEGRFIDRLEQELDKVHTKQKVKAIEIGRRIASAEREVSEVVSRLDSRGPVGRDARASSEDAPTEEEFMMLEEDLSDIIADVHDLAKFVQLNYTGFQKIIKKHDVRVTFSYFFFVCLQFLLFCCIVFSAGRFVALSLNSFIWPAARTGLTDL